MSMYKLAFRVTASLFMALLLTQSLEAREFAAGQLVLRDVPLVITIETGEREGIELTFSDGSDGGQYLEISERGGVLEIRGKPQGKSKIVSSPGNVVIGEVHQFVSGDNAQSTVIIGGRESTITSGSADKRPRLGIRMPETAKLAVYGNCAGLDSGRLKSRLLLRVLGGCSLRFDAVAGGNLRLEGAADVVIGEARGDMDVVIEGAADLLVGQGVIGRLDLSVEGSANVRIAALVKSGSVQLSGASDVEINGRRDNFDVRQSGVADLVFSPR